HVVVAHVGSSVPACSATMYSAYQSGQSGSAAPMRFSCSPWATSARRIALARSLAEPNDVAEASTRPGSRVVTSWNSQLLPSGSLSEAYERELRCSGSSPLAGPPGPRWKTSLISTPAAASLSRRAWMSETIRNRFWADPGTADVRSGPNCTEHAEPGGVNWTTNGGVTSSLHPS